MLAASPTIGSLIAAAVLLGTGNSMLYPTLVALVVDRTPVSERGLAIGTLSGAWDVGVFVGAPLIALRWKRAATPPASSPPRSPSWQGCSRSS